MGVQLKRFPELGVTLAIYSGEIAPEVLFEHLSWVDADDVVRWIGYLDPALDLSLLDLAMVPELKRANAARLKELNVQDARIAFVCASDPNKQFMEFWHRYICSDGDHPAAQELFPDLKAACDWLGLTDAAHQALAAAVAAGEPEAAPEDAFPDRRS